MDRHTHTHTDRNQSDYIVCQNCIWQTNTTETDECRVVDVEPTVITFHRCRAANPRLQDFIINVDHESQCSADQVFNIHSAVLGYSVSYGPNENPPRCPWSNCTKPTDVPARRCNGRRTCRISQEILVFRPGTALCSLHRDGNFIRITFTCVTGMTSLSLLYFIAHYPAEYCVFVLLKLNGVQSTKLLQLVLRRRCGSSAARR